MNQNQRHEQRPGAGAQFALGRPSPSQPLPAAGKGLRRRVLAPVMLCLGTAVTILVFRSHSFLQPGTTAQTSPATNVSEAALVQAASTALPAEWRPPLAPRPETNSQPEGFLAAWLAAQLLTDPMAREEAVNRALAEVTTDMAASLLRGMKPEDLNGDAARRLFDRWASASPASAAAWAQTLAGPELRQSFMNVAVLRWAATDLTGAATWARGLADMNAREAALAAVGSEAVRTAPIEALNLASEMSAGGPAWEDLVSRAAGEWAATDPDRAAAWAVQIQDEALRRRVTGQVVAAMAENDPVGAATIASQQMQPGAEQDRAVVSIVLRWVQSDPKAAADWVVQLPGGSLSRDAAESLINLWADRDLTAAGNWILTLPEGDLRNTAIASYARTLERTDADLAQRWSAVIRKP